MTEQCEETEVIKPWYLQFWPWFIIFFPASAVVAGIITVIIAFENADSLVVDDYYKAGLAINGQFKKQQNAVSYGYSAVLRRMPNNWLYLKFDTAVPDESVLLLNWIHPGDSKKDFSVELKRQLDGSYQAKTTQSLDGRWYLRVSANGDWLIKSEIDAEVDTVHLSPKLN